MCFEYKNKFHTDNDFKVALLKGDFKSMLDNGTLKFDNAKTLFNAIPERSAETLPLATTPRGSEEMGARIPESGEVTNAQVEQPKGKTTGEEPEMTGITHAQMDETAKEFGLETYEKDPEKVSEWDKQANERIAKDPNAIPNLLNRMRDGEMPDHVEQRMMVKYISDLKAKLNENPTSDELLSQLKRAKDLSNIVGGRAVAKSLVARKGEVTVEKTLPDYLLREMESTRVGKLTEQQKAQALKDYENISKAESEHEANMQRLKDENTKLRAQIELNKLTKQKSTSKTNRTSEDFKKEREGLKEQLKKAKEDYLSKLKEQGIRQAGVGGPIITNETAKIIGKIVKSYVDEGLTKLEDITKKVFEDVKDFIDGISEKDIHNIIAGQYNKPQITKNELAIKLRDLKIQAQLVNRLEQLEKGEEPKTEKLKVKKNQEIEDLRNKIKDYKKAEAEANKFYTEEPFKEGEKRTPLEQLKVRTQNQINKVQKDLDTGNFLKEQEEKPKLKLDKEAIESRDKLIKLKQDREIRLMKQEFGKRGLGAKIGNVVSKSLGSLRVLKSSFDVSMPFRQGLWGLTKELISLPEFHNGKLEFNKQRQLAEQFGKMYKAMASEKISDRIMADIHESPRYEIAKKSGLSIAEPNHPLAQAREEFYGPSYVEDLPFIGKSIKIGSGENAPKVGGLVKASEMAATTFVNSMKWDIFNNYVDIFEKQGKTFENAQKEYEAAAIYANQAVGRGKLGEKIERANAITSRLMFSMRLQASRLQLMTNFMNPNFYRRAPKEVIIDYYKDMGKFVGLGLTTLAIAHKMGLHVGVNPYSTDFGKIRVGDTEYDIWGGFSQWAVFLMREISGKTTNSHGKIVDLGKGQKTRGDVLLHFARSKASPEAGVATDLLTGKNYQGQKITPLGEAGELITPLSPQDAVQVAQDGGVQQAFISWILSSHGVGVQTYDHSKKNK